MKIFYKYVMYEYYLDKSSVLVSIEVMIEYYLDKSSIENGYYLIII